MSKKSSALAQVETTSLGMGAEDDLLQVLGDEGFDLDDGLDQVDGDDLQIAVKVFNMKRVDPDTKRATPPDVFFDTVTESTQDEVDAVLTYLHKTNEWREYDESEGRSKVRCRSFDRVTGTLEDGTSRACQNCPDANWQTIEGKRTRRCGPVYNVYAVEKETRAPFVIRFKRSSLRPFKQYLNRYFIGKRIVKGRRANYPLYAYETKLSLRMSDDGKYALPVFQKGSILDRDSIRAAAAEVPFVRDALVGSLERIVDGDHSGDDDGNAIDVTAASAGGRDEFSDDGDAVSQAGMNF